MAGIQTCPMLLRWEESSVPPCAAHAKQRNDGRWGVPVCVCFLLTTGVPVMLWAAYSVRGLVGQLSDGLCEYIFFFLPKLLIGIPVNNLPLP